MNIFLSYSSQDEEKIEPIYYSLSEAHTVFFDRRNIEGGDSFNQKIIDAIDGCDQFIFCISPNSVKNGSFALTELNIAEKKWPHPIGHVIPVIVKETKREEIPSYLKAVSLFETQGNLAAELRIKIDSLQTNESLWKIFPPLTRLRNSHAEKIRVGIKTLGVIMLAATTISWLWLSIGSWRDESRPNIPGQGNGCAEFDLRLPISGHIYSPDPAVVTKYSNGYFLLNYGAFEFQTQRNGVEREGGSATMWLNPLTGSMNVYYKIQKVGATMQNEYRESKGLRFDWSYSKC